jgi:hypothetical protein
LRLVWSDGAIWERDELQGHWCSLDGTLIGEVQRGEVIWDPRFLSPPSNITPKMPLLHDGAVVLHLDGQQSVGTYQPGPPARLRWDDGEVWQRSGFK